MSGFVAQPGVDVTGGDLPEISQRLDILGKRKGVTIYAISGFRTPARSVAVGGFANDPHTKHEAEDIGVNSLLRSSASQLSDADLASVGLTRPFSSASEINHVQLAAGGPSLGDLAKGALGVLSPGTAAAGALRDKIAGGAKDAAAGVAKDAVGALWGAVGADGARALLYVLLVFGGVALAVVGVARATGVGEHVKTAAGSAAKVAALA